MLLRKIFLSVNGGIFFLAKGGIGNQVEKDKDQAGLTHATINGGDNKGSSLQGNPKVLGAVKFYGYSGRFIDLPLIFPDMKLSSALSLCLTIILVNSVVAQQQKRKPGSPMDHLPSNITVLTQFGERADFSPDNQQIAFMAKSFGDAMLYDLKTKRITCLTCNVPGAVFLRVMHLSNGDYILIGPEKFENINISRRKDNELWFLKKGKGSKPLKLGIHMSEGMAISKKSLKIAFSQLHDHVSEIPEGASRLILADLDLSDSIPKLVNQKTIFESPDRNCTLEAQDFYDNDSKLTFTCYEPNGCASVMGIDLKTLAVTNFSQKPQTYNEVEGIVPNSQYTLVEADRQCEFLGGTRGSGNIDIWKLKLDGTGKDFVRVTNFNDYEGYKSSNPVVSTDGKYMAFQLANTKDPAGVGYGILLYRFSQ